MGNQNWPLEVSDRLGGRPWRVVGQKAAAGRMSRVLNPNRALNFSRWVSAGFTTPEGLSVDVMSDEVSVALFLPPTDGSDSCRQYGLRFSTERDIGRFLFKYAADPDRVFVEDFGYGGPNPALVWAGDLRGRPWPSAEG